MKKIRFLLIILLAFTININYAKADKYNETACLACDDDNQTCINTFCDPTQNWRGDLTDDSSNDGLESTVNIESNTYQKMQCGEEQVPYVAAQITHKVIFILQIATVIIIIITGMLDLAKAVMAQKEDDIKKGQQTLIRRIIIGISVFLVFAIVQLVIGLVAPKDDNKSMWKCVDCFVNGDCKGLISD